MEVKETPLAGVLLVRPRVFRDDRGTFMEAWRRERYEAAGIPGEFVQDNVAFSKKNVLRGLHYQRPNPQGKLVMAAQGEVFDVAVDIRRDSPTFGEWYGHRLTAEEGTQLWVPEGFAHGYAVLSDGAVVIYKCTRPYDPEADRAIRWDDPAIGVEWPISRPLISAKDREAPLLDSVGP
ncbi:MAG: dTDP-4-dehydrorhamnose 3,5-epimerase [Gemmatimonadota bacterium]|jgi:dTDP-4-dehydrorhamnose 3,5-epimerase